MYSDIKVTNMQNNANISNTVVIVASQ